MISMTASATVRIAVGDYNDQRHTGMVAVLAVLLTLVLLEGEGVCVVLHHPVVLVPVPVLQPDTCCSPCLQQQRQAALRS